jgi:thioester reductase-like protein
MGVVGNFKDPTLGLPPDVIDDLRKSRCLIIHTAWEVNFNLPLASFEAESIAGTKHLLDLSISVQTAEPARFVLCSSISTAMNSPPGTTVLETAIEEVHHAQATGYARSKFVAEHIAHNAAITAGADVRVMRIGQIVGDSRNGLWNDSEAIPLMIRSASVIGVLPELHDKCSWLPVDQCAVTVLELSGLTKPASKALRFLETSEGPPRYSSALYYNVLHPRVFDWNDDLLPALRNAGLYFTTAPPQEWVRLLERSAADPKINPSVKLLGFWKGRYDRETANREEDGNPSRSMYPVAFSTAEAERDSITLRQAQHCVSTCLVDKFVQRWKSSWTD